MRQSKIVFTITLMLQSFMSNAASASTVGFQPPVSYPTGPVPVAVATGDLNDDGKLDLAVANHGDPSAGDDGSVSIFIGNGDGTFQAASNIPVGKNPQSLALGDFNGDGKLDLAALNSDDTLSVSLQCRSCSPHVLGKCRHRCLGKIRCDRIERVCDRYNPGS